MAILSSRRCQGQSRQKTDVSFNSLISISGYSAGISPVLQNAIFSFRIIWVNMCTGYDNGEDLSVPPGLSAVALLKWTA